MDGSASNDASNMMEAVRHALMLNRLSHNSAEAVTHLDALRWGTEGSARCLGRDDIGVIGVGKQADLALFKLDELRFCGAHDPLAALPATIGGAAPCSYPPVSPLAGSALCQAQAVIATPHMPTQPNT